MSQPEFTAHERLEAEARRRWRVGDELRATLFAVVAIVFLAAAYGRAGEESYRLAQEAERERVALATAREARLWRAHCERRGMDTVALQADGGPWRGHCVERRVLSAAPQ